MYQPPLLLEPLRAVASASRLRVAYSGGCDSHVLLHSLAELRDQLPVPLHALHINHGLSPHADDWAMHCTRICARLGVPLDVVRVQVGHRKALGLEAAAREVRLAAFEQAMIPREALLLGHHADDQAETLLLQLLRGSGVRGAAAMPTIQVFGPGWMCRPLLGWGRAELREYARSLGLSWVEDESNQDEALERNFLRKEIVPRLAGHRGGVVKALARSARHFAEARCLLEERADEDLALVGVDGGRRLNTVALAALHHARRCNLLRSWFDRLNLPPPDSTRLERICTELLAARSDHIPLVEWPGVEVRRYRAEIHAHRPLPYHDASAVVRTAGVRNLDLGEGCGRLTDLPAVNLEVRFRRGASDARRGIPAVPPI